MEKKRDPEGAAVIRDTWDDDRPKEVVHLADHADVAAKLAKLSKGASAGDGWKEREPEGEAPGMIAVGGVNEAKAYLAGFAPAEQPEHGTLEMQRVEVADPRKAVTEVLRRPEVLASGGAGEEGLVTDAGGARRKEEQVETARVKTGRGTRMVVAGIGIGVVAATVPLLMLLGRQPPRRVLEPFPAMAPFVERTSAASALGSSGVFSSGSAAGTAAPPFTSSSVGSSALGAPEAAPQGGVTAARPVAPKVTAPSRPKPPPEIL